MTLTSLSKIKYPLAVMAFMLSVMGTVQAKGNYIVLVDAGGQPISDFVDPQILDQISMEARIKEIQDIERQAAQARSELDNPAKVREKVLTAMFPLVSHSLDPITLQVDIKKPNDNVVDPIAIVGDDAGSRRWLAKHADVFAQMKVTIAVVEAESVEGIQYYKNNYPNLPVSVRVGDELSREFDVPGYPVILTNQGIFQ